MNFSTLKSRLPKNRTSRRVLGWGAALALIAVTALVGHTLALRSGLERLRELGQHRLDLVAAGLASDLARLDYLPSLLEETPTVFALLDATGDTDLRDATNRHLQRINAAAGAANLYVIDTAGRCQAASDWQEPGTPLGADLLFRPYVRDALTRGRGRFYGVGITSKRAGYYLAFALNSQGRLRGVATVKVALDTAEAAWRKLPGEVVVADERGVVILSSREDWKFRPLAPLSPDMRQDIARARTYGDAMLVPLDWKTLEPRGDDGALVRLGGRSYLVSSRTLAQTGWRLTVLDDVAPLRASARNAAVTAALGSAVLLLLGAVLLQRQRGLRMQLASRARLQAAHDTLEAKVVERTAELRSTVAQLGAEVEARKAIEADLRTTQDELVHAGKMAALGQMSAGVVHEMNQPLGAMRTLSDNACVLLEQQRPDEAKANLQRIVKLVDRLANLTRQLKGFAYKSSPARARIDVSEAITQAHLALSQRLRAHGIDWTIQVRPRGLAALADESRLEQVLVNLIGNAIDAMADAPVRRLALEAAPSEGDAGRCVIRVTDSGPGIREDILARLFEPFVTSKPAGAGLGLGLMISAHIVRELGGSLRADNLADGGACFVIELPIAAPLQDAPDAPGAQDHPAAPAATSETPS